MKKAIKISLLSLLAIASIAAVVLYKAMPVGTGYTAKYLCSHVFTLGQDPATAMEQFVKPVNKLFEFVTYEVDVEKKEVTASGFGFLRPMTAIYREGCGCTLLADASREELLAQMANLTIEKPVLPDTVWPIGNRFDPELVPANVNLPKLNEVIRQQFEETTSDPAEMVNTLAIVVAYKNRIVAEQYREGITDTTPLLSWSASKSITGALIGTLVKNRGFDIMAPAPVAAWQNDERKRITTDQLLRMESGLKFREMYIPMTDVVEMLYESGDMGALAASKSPEAGPGSRWAYSSGTTNILSKILFDQTGGSLASVENFARRYLFDKLGMTTAIFEHEAAGTFVGSSYFYASPKDWLRFCLLYKNCGVWNGEQLLPEGWVDYSLTPTPNAPLGQYGAQIWLNRGKPENPSDRLLPKLPTDTFVFQGYQGQWFIVIPSKDLMIARFGITNTPDWSMEDLVVDILGAIRCCGKDRIGPAFIIGWTKLSPSKKGRRK